MTKDELLKLLPKNESAFDLAPRIQVLLKELIEKISELEESRMSKDKTSSEVKEDRVLTEDELNSLKQVPRIDSDHIQHIDKKNDKPLQENPQEYYRRADEEALEGGEKEGRSEDGEARPETLEAELAANPGEGEEVARKRGAVEAMTGDEVTARDEAARDEAAPKAAEEAKKAAEEKEKEDERLAAEAELVNKKGSAPKEKKRSNGNGKK
jgi:hypothetical protein